MNNKKKMTKNRTKVLDIFRNNTTITTSVEIDSDGEYGRTKLNMYDDHGQFFTFEGHLAPNYDMNKKTIAQVNEFRNILNDFMDDLEKANEIIETCVKIRNRKNAEHQKKRLKEIKETGPISFSDNCCCCCKDKEKN